LDIALLERLPTPVGIIAPSNGNTGSTASGNTIAIAGNVNNAYTALTTSHVYYTSTKGNLVTVNGFYPGWVGNVGDSVNNDGNDDGIVVDVVNNILLTADAQVGIALSANTLLIKTNSNN